MQVTEDEKFIFPEKEFLSELYRNCPEDPKIAILLQNGEAKEKNIARKWIIFEELPDEELQFELSEQEYGAIALRRGKPCFLQSKGKAKGGFSFCEKERHMLSGKQGKG